MDLDIEQSDVRSSVAFDVPQDSTDAAFSLDECKKFLGKYNLSDEKILLIRNSIIAISDSVINCYIDEFTKNT